MLNWWTSRLPPSWVLPVLQSHTPFPPPPRPTPPFPNQEQWIPNYAARFPSLSRIHWLGADRTSLNPRSGSRSGSMKGRKGLDPQSRKSLKGHPRPAPELLVRYLLQCWPYPASSLSSSPSDDPRHSSINLQHTNLHLRADFPGNPTYNIRLFP